MSSQPLNLNLLRSLDVVLETRNLTLAAKMLGLTQSALSRQLAQLREQLNDPLLIREGQRYLLTERALSLRAPLKMALANMDAVLDTPAFDPALCTREFTLCGSDYIADHMLSELLRRIAPQAPRLRLRMRMWEPDHYRLLTDEGIDLVPTIADAVPDNLHGRALGQDRAVCVMRAGHALAAHSLTLADYLHAAHARVSGGGDKDSLVDQALAAQGAQREIRLTVPLIASALRIVADSDLLLTLPE